MKPIVSAGKAERDERRFPIFINDTRHVVNDTPMTGAELKALGSIPLQNKLFREARRAGADEEICDDQTVDLKPLRSILRFAGRRCRHGRSPAVRGHPSRARSPRLPGP